ncbi:MAG: hypothetical protein JWR65_3239 [Massilia sp.]|nr:hypothetical protein [Massilia sp.]
MALEHPAAAGPAKNIGIGVPVAIGDMTPLEKELEVFAVWHGPAIKRREDKPSVVARHEWRQAQRFQRSRIHLANVARLRLAWR